MTDTHDVTGEQSLRQSPKTYADTRKCITSDVDLKGNQDPCQATFDILRGFPSISLKHTSVPQRQTGSHCEQVSYFIVVSLVIIIQRHPDGDRHDAPDWHTPRSFPNYSDQGRGLDRRGGGDEKKMKGKGETKHK